jgi:hypothetical protein
MKRLMAICLVIVLAVTMAEASVTVNFTEVDLGSSSQVDLTNQFATYGITFDHVYRYIDSRDPWPEGGGYGYGISNGWLEQNNQPGQTGTVMFTQATPYVSIDWWNIGSNQINVDAYDGGGNLIDSFVGLGVDAHGTETLSGIGSISYLTFHDGGGFVSIANMTFENSVVPAPGAMLLGSIGVSLVGWMRRRRMM